MQALFEEAKSLYMSPDDKLILQVQLAKDSLSAGPFRQLEAAVHLLGKAKLQFERACEQAACQEVSEYEGTIQQLESKVREHIRVEQQLRLWAEDTKNRLQELERKNERHVAREKELEKEIKALKSRTFETEPVKEVERSKKKFFETIKSKKKSVDGTKPQRAVTSLNSIKTNAIALNIRKNRESKHLNLEQSKLLNLTGSISKRKKSKSRDGANPYPDTVYSKMLKKVTHSLYDLCEQTCKRQFHFERAKEGTF